MPDTLDAEIAGDLYDLALGHPIQGEPPREPEGPTTWYEQCLNRSKRFTTTSQTARASFAGIRDLDGAMLGQRTGSASGVAETLSREGCPSRPSIMRRLTSERNPAVARYLLAVLLLAVAVLIARVWL